jgi:hypothetical protein
MFASIRRYRLQHGPMDELMRRVDESFADQIALQQGFVSYEFIDCGDGEIMTVSLFGAAEEAAGSRELAQHWTAENLEDFQFTRIEALDGEVMVSRAMRDMLEPWHAGPSGRFASVRRYQLRGGSVGELMHVVDEVFADAIEQMDGFEAYHALDCGRGDLMSISLFRDQSSAEESDERSLAFVRESLGRFDIERTEVIGGDVCVSRAVAELLLPAHA